MQCQNTELSSVNPWYLSQVFASRWKSIFSLTYRAIEGETFLWPKSATSYNIQKCCNKNLTIFKLDPTQSNMLQHVATGWPNASNTRHYFIVFILFFILQEIVAMLSLKPGQKVLDVGCGIGGSGFYMVKVWLDPFFLSLVEKAGSIRVQSTELSQSCHAICQIVLCATFF